MADMFRYPFRRSVNYTGAYRVDCGKNSLPILEDMQFEAVAGGSYTLSADPGVYVLTGSPIAVVVGRSVSAAPGAYTLSGSAATITRRYAVQCAAGNYTLSGSAAAVVVGRTVPADAGSYALTGSDAAITVSAVTGYTVACEPGSYVITGADTALTVSVPQEQPIIGWPVFDSSLYRQVRDKKRKEDEARQKELERLAQEDAERQAAEALAEFEAEDQAKYLARLRDLVAQSARVPAVEISQADIRSIAEPAVRALLLEMEAEFDRYVTRLEFERDEEDALLVLLLAA